MPCRCDAIDGSPQSSLTSVAPSLAVLAYRTGSEEEAEEGNGERAPGTFSTIDENVEEGEEARDLNKYRK